MEQGFDISAALGPVQRPSLLSTVKTAVLPFWNRPTVSPSPAAAEPSNLQRAKYTFCSDGLRVSALINFIAICGGEKKIKNLSTRQVVDKYILPVTASIRSSYCELVKTRDPSVISPATVYISHSWGARFMDTYRAIKYHFRHAPDTVLWMDIFCLDQRVFYPLKLRNSAKARLNGYDEDDAFATVATTAAATAITGSTGPPPNSLLSPESRFFSPAVKRGTGQQPQQHAYGTESPIAMSVYSDGGYEEGPLEPTASAAASAAAAAIGAPAASSYRRSVPSHNSAPTLAGGGRQQWNGMHNMAGGAGDWCADILKHGMDAIGSVLLVINPAPNPEPMSGNIPVDDNSTRATKSDVPGEGPGSPDTVSSPRGRVHWDRSRYMNPINALSRLWCLYEIYCTTVVRDSDAVGGILPSIASPTARSTAAAAAMDTAAHHQRGSNSRPSSSTSRQGSAPSREGTQKRRNKNQCAFDIALHYSILDDDEHNTNSSNVRNKRSPFAVDLEATCRDFEHLTKWICCMDLAQCEASDAADAQRLLHIISVDIGSGIFFETVRNVLEEWVHATLNTVSTERPAAAARGASNSSSTSTNTNTSYNTITNKQRLYVQHCVCKLYHIRGDPVRAEGAMIELGEVQRGRFGANHPDFIDSLQYLAEFYLQQKRHADAEPLLVECLERRKAVLGPQHPDTIHSIDTLANLYEVLGAFHLAEPLFEECHELRKATLGPTHIHTLKSMYSVAAMMFNQEEYPQTEVLMRECLDLRRSALGPSHLDTILSLQKLAVLYELMHNFPAAELVYHEYLHAVMHVYGTDHVNTIHALYLLGTNYKNQYKYALAEQLFRVSAEKYKTTLAPDHECTMRVLYDLAALYEDLARYEQSMTVRSNYFALCKAKYGEECAHKQYKSPVKLRSDLRDEDDITHISTIQENARAQQQAAADCAKTHQCMFELARLHIAMGKCVRALPLLTRCLELRLLHVGVSDLDTLATQNMLAVVHINSGNYEEAEQLLVHVIEEGGRLGSEQQAQRNGSGEQRARPLPVSQQQQRQQQQRHLSPSKDSGNPPPPLPVVLDAMSNLGLLYSEQGKMSEAEALFMNVWESYRLIYGGDQHPDVLTIVHNLGGHYLKQRKYDLAEFFYSDCLKKRTAVLGPQHPATMHTLCNLAYAYTQQGKCDIAEHMILENQAQCHIVLGADHPLTLRHINNHAANCEAQGNLRKAELLYKQCLVKRRLSQGATHPETLSSSNNLACLYVKQLQQLKEAERMFKECLKERQRIVGLRHPDTLSTINNIATLYWRTDKADLAHDVYIDCTEECVEQLGRAHPVAAAALENLQELVTQLQQLNGTNLELEDHHQQQQQEQEQQGEEEERPAEEKPLSIQTSPNPSPKAKKHRHHRYEHASSGEDHGQHRRSRRKK